MKPMRMYKNNMNKLGNSYYKMLDHNQKIPLEEVLEKIQIKVQEIILLL